MDQEPTSKTTNSTVAESWTPNETFYNSSASEHQQSSATKVAGEQHVSQKSRTEPDVGQSFSGGSIVGISGQVIGRKLDQSAHSSINNAVPHELGHSVHTQITDKVGQGASSTSTSSINSYASLASGTGHNAGSQGQAIENLAKRAKPTSTSTINIATVQSEVGQSSIQVLAPVSSTGFPLPTNTSLPNTVLGFTGVQAVRDGQPHSVPFNHSQVILKSGTEEPTQHLDSSRFSAHSMNRSQASFESGFIVQPALVTSVSHQTGANSQSNISSSYASSGTINISKDSSNSRTEGISPTFTEQSTSSILHAASSVIQDIDTNMQVRNSLAALNKSPSPSALPSSPRPVIKCQNETSNQLKNFLLSSAEKPTQSIGASTDLSYQQVSAIDRQWPSSSFQVHGSVASHPVSSSFGAVSTAANTGMVRHQPSSPRAMSPSHASVNRVQQQISRIPILDDDDDDDQDYIPVGVVQLTSLNKAALMAANANFAQQFSAQAVPVSSQVPNQSPTLSAPVSLKGNQSKGSSVQSKPKRPRAPAKPRQKKTPSATSSSTQGQQQRHLPSPQPDSTQTQETQFSQLSRSIESPQSQTPPRQHHELLRQLVEQAQFNHSIQQLAPQQQNPQLQQQTQPHHLPQKQSTSPTTKQWQQNLIQLLSSESQRMGAGLRQPSLPRTESQSRELLQINYQNQEDENQRKHQTALGKETSYQSGQHQGTAQSESKPQSQAQPSTSGNIPKIAEQLLLQHFESQQDQSLEALIKGNPAQPGGSAATKPLVLDTQLLTTPLSVSQHINPATVNKQHPEISRMLNSPVSPRQGGSPRQPGSPRCPPSPQQPPPDPGPPPAQFAPPSSTRQLQSPRPQQPNIMGCLVTPSPRPSVSLQATVHQSRQTVSREQTILQSSPHQETVSSVRVVSPGQSLGQNQRKGFSESGIPVTYQTRLDPSSFLGAKSAPQVGDYVTKYGLVTSEGSVPGRSSYQLPPDSLTKAGSGTVDTLVQQSGFSPAPRQQPQQLSQPQGNGSYLTDSQTVGGQTQHLPNTHFSMSESHRPLTEPYRSTIDLGFTATSVSSDQHQHVSGFRPPSLPPPSPSSPYSSMSYPDASSSPGAMVYPQPQMSPKQVIHHRPPQERQSPLDRGSIPYPGAPSILAFTSQQSGQTSFANRQDSAHSTNRLSPKVPGLFTSQPVDIQRLVQQPAMKQVSESQSLAHAQFVNAPGPSPPSQPYSTSDEQISKVKTYFSGLGSSQSVIQESLGDIENAVLQKERETQSVKHSEVTTQANQSLNKTASKFVEIKSTKSLSTSDPALQSKPSVDLDLARTEDARKTVLSQIATTILAVSDKVKATQPQGQGEMEVKDKVILSNDKDKTDSGLNAKSKQERDQTAEEGNVIKAVVNVLTGKDNTLKELAQKVEETPKREARVRKPSKRFEPEDETPVRRKNVNNPKSPLSSPNGSNHNTTKKSVDKKSIGKTVPDSKQNAKKMLKGYEEDPDYNDEEEEEEEEEKDKEKATNRRLSRRLQVRQKEKEESTAEEDSRIQRPRRHSAKINYKEFLDTAETTSLSSRRSSVSASSSDDNVRAADSSEHMVTRRQSKKTEESADEKMSESDSSSKKEDKTKTMKKVESESDADEKRPSRPLTRHQISAKTDAGSDSKKSSLATRQKSTSPANSTRSSGHKSVSPAASTRSVGQKSVSPATSTRSMDQKSVSPATSTRSMGQRSVSPTPSTRSRNSTSSSAKTEMSENKTLTRSSLNTELKDSAKVSTRSSSNSDTKTPPGLGRRHSRRQEETEEKTTKSSSLTKAKRPAPSEFVDELPPWRKKVKAEEKTDQDKKQGSEGRHSAKEAKVESKKGTDGKETEIVSEKSGLRSRKSAHGTKADVLEKETGKDEKSDHEDFESKSGLRKSRRLQKAEAEMIEHDEDISDKQSNSDSEGTSGGSKKINTSDFKSKNIVGKDNETESEDSKTDNKEDFDTTLVDQVNRAKEKIKDKVKTDKSLSDNVRTVSGSLQDMQKPGRKLVLYRLVPVSEEEMEFDEDSLVPVSGYVMPAVRNGCILLPEKTPGLPPKSATDSPYIQAPKENSVPNNSRLMTSSANLSSPDRTPSAFSPPHRHSLSSQPSSGEDEVIIHARSAHQRDSSIPLSVGAGRPSAISMPSPSSSASPSQRSHPAQTPGFWGSATPPPSSSTPSSSSSWQSMGMNQQQSLSQQQPWNSQPPPSEPLWNPSGASAAVESWSKEFLSNPTFGADQHSKRQGSLPSSSLYAINSPQEPDGSAEVNNNGLYSSADDADDQEFTDSSRQTDSLIQTFLRQISTNPGGFSSELAGFNLAQQDFAYLESRLRQALSPNTLFSAMAAYEEANSSSPSNIASQENSLHDGMNLVHTVNLDEGDDGNLPPLGDGFPLPPSLSISGPSQHSQSLIRRSLSPEPSLSTTTILDVTVSPPTSVSQTIDTPAKVVPSKNKKLIVKKKKRDEADSTRKVKSQPVIKRKSRGIVKGKARHMVKSKSQLAKEKAKVAMAKKKSLRELKLAKKDTKLSYYSPPKVRRHTYKIFIDNEGRKKCRCLICNKLYNMASIYRHLRIHDPDCHIICDLCNRKFVQTYSYNVHRRGHVRDGDISPEEANYGCSGGQKKATVAATMLEKKKDSPRGLTKNKPQLRSATKLPPSKRIRGVNSATDRKRALDEKRSVSGGKKMPDVKKGKKISVEPESVGDPIVLDDKEIRLHQDLLQQIILIRKAKVTKESLASVCAVMETNRSNEMTSSESRPAVPMEANNNEKLTSEGKRTGSTFVEETSIPKEVRHPSSETSAEVSTVYKEISEKSFSDIQAHFEKDVTKSSTTSVSKSSTTSVSKKTDDLMASGGSKEDGSMSQLGVLSGEEILSLERAGEVIEAVARGEGEVSSGETASDVVRALEEHSFTYAAPPVFTPVSRGDKVEVVKDGERVELPPCATDGIHACPKCGVVLKTRNNLLLHIRRHNNLKTKVCDVCNMAFHTSQELKSHVRTHTKEKPFQCHICLTQFGHKGSLEVHKKGHLKRGELEPFPVQDGKVIFPPTMDKYRERNFSGSASAEGSSDAQTSKATSDKQPAKIKKKKSRLSVPAKSEGIAGSDSTGSGVSGNVPGDGSAQSMSSGISSSDVPRRSSLDSSLERQYATLDGESAYSFPRQSLQTTQPGLNTSDPNLSSGLTGGPISQSLQQTGSYYPSSQHHQISSGSYQSLPRQGMNQHSMIQEGFPRVSQPSETLLPGPSQHFQPAQQVNVDLNKQQSYPAPALSQSATGGNVAAGMSMQGNPYYQYDSSMASSSGVYRPEFGNTQMTFQSSNTSGDSEIVKTLLQHFNVPSNSYPETIDYSQPHLPPPPPPPPPPASREFLARPGPQTYPEPQPRGPMPAPPPSYSDTMQQKQQQQQYYSQQTQPSMHHPHSSLQAESHRAATSMEDRSAVPSPHVQNLAVYRSPQNSPANLQGNMTAYRSPQNSPAHQPNVAAVYRSPQNSPANPSGNLSAYRSPQSSPANLPGHLSAYRSPQSSPAHQPNIAAYQSPQNSPAYPYPSSVGSVSASPSRESFSPFHVQANTPTLPSQPSPSSQYASSQPITQSLPKIESLSRDALNARVQAGASPMAQYPSDRPPSGTSHDLQG